ncbi:aromatic ring-hydroxylating oxygenase subunit alpha [Thauera linaloolentis]|uniref:Rieske (2Fe-2S) domain-containing protein n=1 Tax=Thauera linaloolentis (strain DSM 12138 / JCM 21573 / CCUG 41526 / CIP 105981 / IAM 15112 / NBRC 102519 / 47Lol) TaxID=1123367 RepID=N6YYT3_THAL4|nr:aromatic ring-hydroxylating dioxygenase subunit alpha [Thauera linaloolentis]ENO87298.1 Rieske (2Fe-2S) domain-containing protein [Thauera linaloolentis 47Lol = DSM 12138]MCM8566747.1 aromatic ring-hydroxylating dioxygenase subunit alpha [Thauera linaloolentis]
MNMRDNSIQALVDAERLQNGSILRGDPISGDRYYSKEFARKEWDHVFTRTWQIGGTVAQLEKPGSVITQAIGEESILITRADDGVIRAFYNVCPHRGNRLVAEDQKCGVKRMVCAYHSWTFSLDGVVRHVRDAEDYPQGNPIGNMKLVEIRCETLGALVWFNMDDKAPSLREYLGVAADIFEQYQTGSWVRVNWLTGLVDCNWKIIHDNFNEAYHILSLHREIGPFINDAYQDTDFQLYKSGHNLMKMQGGVPSANARHSVVPDELAGILREWEIDPEAFGGRVRETRAALQQQKRKLGPARGHTHYDHLSDEQLTDYHHLTVFPNTTLTMAADFFQVLRPLPHPSDPERCYFDHWVFMPPVEGRDEVDTPLGKRRFEQAEHESFLHGEASIGFVADQDLSVAIAQQKGLHSRGYKDAYLTGQEERVRRLHEVINDYIEGRR